jgi:hypothetical protein
MADLKAGSTVSPMAGEKVVKMVVQMGDLKAVPTVEMMVGLKDTKKADC